MDLIQNHKHILHHGNVKQCQTGDKESSIYNIWFNYNMKKPSELLSKGTFIDVFCFILSFVS